MICLTVVAWAAPLGVAAGCYLGVARFVLGGEFTLGARKTSSNSKGGGAGGGAGGDMVAEQQRRKVRLTLQRRKKNKFLFICHIMRSCSHIC